MTSQRPLINIGVREIDEDVWLAFKVYCVQTRQ